MKYHIYSSIFIIALFLCSCGDDTEKLIDPYMKIELDEEVYNASIEGGSKNIKIYTNLPDWELVPMVAGGYDWCQTSIGLSASHIHLLMLTVAPNNGVGVREAEFVLRGSGVPDLSFKVAQLGTKPAILVKPVKSLSKDAQTFSIEVTANVEYTLRNEKDWLKPVEETPTRSMVKKEHKYTVTENTDLTSRKDVIYVESDELEEPVEIPIEQLATEMVEVPEVGEKIEDAAKSVKLVQGAHYADKVIGNTIDGKLDTWFSSTGARNTVIIEYELNVVEQIDYIMLQPNPKANATNQLNKGKVFYKTAAVSTWVECGEFNDAGMSAPVRIDVGIMNPTDIRLELEHPQDKGNLSFAEFECYLNKSEFDLEADAAYFQDDVFSELKPGVTPADFDKITLPIIKSIARALYDGSYSKEFRSRTYKSCVNPQKVKETLSIGKRSICDNPTGLFFQKEKNYIVFVGEGIGKKTLTLHIRDWRKNFDESNDVKRQEFSLRKGMNVVKPTIDGTGYIQYWTDSEDNALDDVNVHVCNGEEIGFWDVRAGHTNEDWLRILKLAEDCTTRLNIENAMLDVLGEHVQLVNKVTAFRQYCPDDIQTIMDLHDELMQIEYSMIGLVKNNAVPKNRILGVRSWGGNPCWDGTSANYPGSEKNMLTKQGFLEDIWLFGHEFGHGNQVEQMKNGGWAEVTNNIYTQQAMYLMCNSRCRLEQEDDYPASNYTVKCKGDRFNGYFYDAVIQDKPYLTHGGEFKDDDRGQYYTSNTFIALVPFWQLSLFFTLSEGTEWYAPDFWADIHWDAIQNNVSSRPYGERYVQFMKRAIDASGYNLTTFFEQMGLLQTEPIDMYIGDYGDPKKVTITKKEMDEVKAYASTKKAAPTPVIHYISGNSLEAYKKKLPVEGTFGQGITDGEGSKTINHKIWKNVVVFETYSGDKLMEISIVGTGSGNNSTTYVRYPEGATRIEAVAWDGTKTLVCGTR